MSGITLIVNRNSACFLKAITLVHIEALIKISGDKNKDKAITLCITSFLMLPFLTPQKIFKKFNIISGKSSFVMM